MRTHIFLFLIACLTIKPALAIGSGATVSPPPDSVQYSLLFVDSVKTHYTIYSPGEDMVVTYRLHATQAGQSSRSSKFTVRGSLQTVTQDQIEVADVWIPVQQITGINMPGKGNMTTVRTLGSAALLSLLLLASPILLFLGLLWDFCPSCSRPGSISQEAMGFLALGALTGIFAMYMVFDPGRKFWGAKVALSKRYFVRTQKSR